MITGSDFVSTGQNVSFFGASLNGSGISSLKQARQEWGWSLMDLAREIEQIRYKKKLPFSSLENIRRQIIDCEKKNHAGPLWRELFAEALRKNPEELFGMGVLSELPFSDFCSTSMVPEVLHLFHTKLDTIVRFEHMFGATSVKNALDNDLLFLKNCFPAVPRELYKDFGFLIARVSELAGWVTQELGDYEQADRLTCSAYDYYRYSTVEQRAKILMRRSNIVLNSDPLLALHMIEEAEGAIAKVNDYPRLKSAIFLQRGLVQFRLNDLQDFHSALSQAHEYIDSSGIHTRPASYMSPAYIASEVADCFLSVKKYKDAADLLMGFRNAWPAGQQRDESLYLLRLLLAVTNVGDFQTAVGIVQRCVALFRAAPSFRGRLLVRKIMQVLSLQRTPNILRNVRILEDTLKPIT